MRRSKVVLLGPQRLQPTLIFAVESLGVHGRIAAVTAGWEEREAEDDELSAHLGGRTINLRLYARGQDVSARDPELFQAVRARSDALRTIHEIYQLRLTHELSAANELLRRELDDPSHAYLSAECEAAIEAVRRLDAFHAQRMGEIYREFEERWMPFERPAVALHRRELALILQEVECLCVAGGHVGRLMQHLRLFGLFGILPEIPVIGWSAGAMVLGERIVLFHDTPPQGTGNAEVYDVGVGLCRGVVPLPHASKRLQLGNLCRVRLMARRFRGSLCAVLDPRTRLDWTGRRWRGDTGTLRLCEDGTLAEVNAA